MKKINLFLKYSVFERLKIQLFLMIGFLKRFKIYLKKTEKRILGIWDCKTANLTVGDSILFHLKLLCMAYSKRVKKIDFAYIYHPSRKVGDNYLVTSENFYYHFSEVLSLLNLNNKLGSVFYFDNSDVFEDFFTKNKQKYVDTHVSFNKYMTRKYCPTIKTCYDLKNFYLKEGFLPKLHFKPFIINQVKQFIKSYVGCRLMVTVSLRNNSSYAFHRNSDFKVWNDFFEYALENRPDIVFVILGRKNEFGEKINKASNIVFFNAEENLVENHLALISYSFFHMGSCSGISTTAIFSDNIPYIITNITGTDMTYNYDWLMRDKKFPWQEENRQYLIWTEENYEILTTNFNKILAHLDEKKYSESLDLSNIDESVLEWPYKTR